MYQSIGKPFLDYTIAIFCSLLLLPLFILIAFLIKLDSKGPVFFKQQRVGKKLRTFNLYKFRSMTNKQHSVSKIIARGEGVTKVGYWLRRFKVDELPQLLNILMGEMSIVGPRPGVLSHLETLSDQQRQRYEVNPGLTGLAQVSGNIHLSWADRITYDLKYVNKVSFPTDVKIILRTFLIIIYGEGKYINSSFIL